MAATITVLHAINITVKAYELFFFIIHNTSDPTRKIDSTEKSLSKCIITQALNLNLGEVLWLKTFLEEINPPIAYSNNNLWDVNILLRSFAKSANCLSLHTEINGYRSVQFQTQVDCRRFKTTIE